MTEYLFLNKIMKSILFESMFLKLNKKWWFENVEKFEFYHIKQGDTLF